MTGEIPTNLSSCSDLQVLFLHGNHLIGQIPIGISSLHKLQKLWIANNNLTGRIPSFIGNLSSLTTLGMARNHLEGNIPQEMCSLKNLTIMQLGENRLYGAFPSCLYNMSSLTIISATLNEFNGSLPSNMFNTLSNLQYFIIGGNKFSGTIPISIANASALRELHLPGNNLVGQVPSLGKLHDLQLLNLEINNLGNLSTQLSELFLGGNQISGKLPAELGNLIGLILLSVDSNHFEGIIPTTFGKFGKMQVLGLTGNVFSGKVPAIIGNLSQLYLLRMSDNMFEEVGNLISINKLDVSENHLSSDIPRTIGDCIGLEYLFLQGNSFNGTIPTSLDSLKGEVPIEGVFGNVSRLAVTGNSKLCGGISELHLQPCPVKGLKHKRNQKQYSDSPTTDSIAKVSYQNLHNGTDGFSASNLVGLGSFGSVYKGNLASEDKVVAIKVLNLQKKGAHKSFIAEYYKGQEFKALVFEYMSNGSLEQWLHPGIMNAWNQRMLDLDQRLNITIDIASVLHYLHHDCDQTIIHCDLKPSNVLLDDDMVARVSDFGIARLVSVVDDTSHQETSTIGIKGTVGYAPPEYGMGSEISTYGDMYSFGVLMLEMLTARRPADEMFEDGQNLHMFVENSFPNNLIQILDPHLLPRSEEATIEDGNIGSFTPIVEKCLVSLFHIGLACSMESPKERMNIVDVTRELSIIKKAYLTGVHSRD
ncbi:hypothetical protein TSUD_235810 [Trifolium subterraneum]|nr:hypothetical protein TSUD_235810 [Trifolium subterraneum]